LIFPDIVTSINEASSGLTRKVDAIIRVDSVSSLDEVSNLDKNTSSKQLQCAITSLPELTARKTNINMHMNMAMLLLDMIKERQLNMLFQMEKQIGR
ncbi:Vesicle trafficking between the ER and Golgi, partial [Coemansia erecta]